MEIGLIGLPNSGKTSIFNALTRSEAEVTAYANPKAEPNLAVVDVEDARIKQLSEMYQPKKTVFATIKMIDFVGVTEGSGKEGLFGSAVMTMVKATNAIAIVVRNFDDELEGPPEPLKDLSTIDDELLFADLIVAENRLERIRKGYKRGQKTAELQFEEKVLERIHQQLSDNAPIREMSFVEDEEKILRGFQFMTHKPLMVILNSSETLFGKSDKVLQDIRRKHKAIEFAGKFEMELVGLDDEEAQLFMEDMNISQSAQARLTKFAHEIMGYINFFTVGSDEVRAWNIRQGDNAVLAAGAIHSDLARGFIRAECFSYANLLECGSEKALKEKGLMQLEGKDYIVKDGDILNIRFSV